MAAFTSPRSPTAASGASTADSPTNATTADASPGAARNELVTMNQMPFRHLRIHGRPRGAGFFREAGRLQAEQMGIAPTGGDELVVAA
jgi:hypothetical protein